MELSIINNYNFKFDEYHDINVISVIRGIEKKTYLKMPNVSDIVPLFRDLGWEKDTYVSSRADVFKHHINGIVDGVGVVVYFGHKDACFSKFMALQSLFLQGLINSCYFITQTLETAELRNTLKNPKNKGTGNRISFHELNAGMDYYSSFITVPIKIIGIELTENNFANHIFS